MKHFKNHQMGIVLSLICILKLLIRALYIGDLHLFFLPWNLILGIFPYGISHFIVSNHQIIDQTKKLLVLLFLWLLFLPNAFYVLTDFIHLKLSTSKTIWFDGFTIASFALTSWWFGLKSINHVRQIYQLRFQKMWPELLDYVIPFVIALGVYMGRFDRFNSWDIITTPHQIVLTAFSHLMNIQTLVIILFYGLIVNLTLKKTL